MSTRKQQYEQLYSKYVKMASTKTAFQISDNILTPTMGEMIEEDLSYDSIMQITGESVESTTKAAYYLDPPFTENLGYDKDLDAMLVEAPIKISTYNGKEVMWSWGQYDGDTLYFDVSKVNSGTNPLELSEGTYKNFEEYFKTNAKVALDKDASMGVRFVGMNCAEIPHFGKTIIKDTNLKNRIVKKKIGEIKNNSNYVYWKYPTDNKYDFDQTYTERDDNEEAIFLKTVADGKTLYNELVKNKGVEQNFEPKVGGKISENFSDKAYLESSGYTLPRENDEKGVIPFLIVSQDDTTKNSIKDGYKAQKAIKERLAKSGNKTTLVLDLKTLAQGTKFEQLGFALYSPYFASEYISTLLKGIMQESSEVRLSGYSYSGYGIDTYGRYLAAAYVKTEDGNWINLNKYVISNTEQTVVNPDYTGHPELANKNLTDAFNLWSYDFNRYLWLDSFEELTEKSYEARIRLHEDLSGLKFCNIRSNSLLIGDTLMLIPPTNIRNITQTNYEKTPLLRSKGQITKGGNHNESILELTLYFAGDHGINGIPYKVELPSGEQTTYYMNGLRSLIAQFKLAPFLPIENEYINDVLNIEAVSLLNLQVTTVPDYPHMLQAVLTLREFNYRMFMPDLPIGIEAQTELSQKTLAETNPIFAKAFQWEVFRYYYQRQLLAGETIHKLEYNSQEYNSYLYRGVTALKPTTLCDSNISFYIPDIDWLDKALTMKKDKDDAVVDFNKIELTQNTRNFAKTIGESLDSIFAASSDATEEYNKGLGNGKWLDKMMLTLKTNYGTWKNYLDGHTRLSVKGCHPILDLYVPIHNAIEKKLLSTGLFTEVRGTETVKDIKDPNTNQNDGKTLTWTINAKLGNISSLSTQELSSLKEFIGINLDTEKSDILKDNSLSIKIHINFDKNGKAINTVYDDDLFNAIAKNLRDIGDNILTTADKNNIDDEDHNYRDPSKMPFVPLIENVVASEMSISLSNLFTETKLKSVDGVSGQYVGGQDSTINIKIITCDKLVVATLNAIPSISFQFTNDYKRIMSCTPIRIKSDFTQLYGINEVAVEMIDINTIENMPGAYEIVMRLSSLDRTTRQRETLKKMNFTSNGGFVGTGSAGSQSIKSFFEIEDVLSKVELYPDLEIPTLEELKLRGYAYVRYSLSNGKRAYPDPDFYMVYAHSYTAAIIKAQVKNFFDNLSSDEESGLETFEVYDTETSEKFITKLDEVTGLSLVGQNIAADITDKELSIISNALKKAEEKNDNKNSSTKKSAKDTEKALKYLMASNVTDGWDLKPTWSAPLCDASTNELITKLPKAGSNNNDLSNNSAAYKLKTTRRDMIKYIDAILSKPIDLSDVSIDIKSYSKKTQESKIDASISSAVSNMFVKDSNGAKLLKLLNPLKDSYFATTTTETYDKAEMTSWIKGFTCAAACVNSAEKDWNYEFFKKKIGSGDWGPRMWFNESSIVHNQNSDYKNVYVPLCRVENSNVAMPIKKGLTNKQIQDNMIEDAITRGTVFGPFGIRIYTVDELIGLTTPDLNIKYVSENEYPLYKHTLKAGFLDPYYNKLNDNSEELIKYKKGIMLNSYVAAQAFLRNVLVWIRKLILDGLFVSEADILSDDLLTLFTNSNKWTEDGRLPDINTQTQDAKTQIKRVLQSMNDSLISHAFKVNSDETEELSDLYLMYASLCDLLPKSFCARMIYPIFLAATNGSPLIYGDMKVRNYNALKSAVNASLSGNVEDALSKQVCTFFNAMAGLEMIDIEDTEKSWTDMGQKIANAVNKEVYLEFANNPKVYTMHSYYDMLMNDKRGRLVRAFPTYYMILIDEGRKIGYWKLHDNFYNMSSISDIQIVKSRKMAADTASVTMTNGYNSYATEHDNSTKEKYADLYGVRDVFDSIFSPKRYYEKAEEIRQNSEIKDKVVLKPGVRMHIRMGYSSDAAKMPVMFNGRITEVNAGEVVDIVAQGDGVELTNPLNTLGNIEANQIDTAQSLFFPSWFTDARGSWSKGGLSPKNLLTSILSAEYGGLEGIVNHISNGRYFNNNAFGIVHFGDMRYTEIFETGETAQNLYEVSDGDLLPDKNTLGKEGAEKKSTPIINTSLYDKTFWDLMHIAAKAGKDYNAAVRDFGFRSTIFLGQNNHYYAYDYKQVNGKVFEKRKPFQQYHFVEPYNDIIYNTIRASETDIRTNATGIWQATNWTFGRKSSTVGPVYLDINIYPEYQKSMTYDTGLLADGNGGIDINPITKIFEGHAFSGKFGQEDKTYDDKVNVKLAERMTINALKESVKDMYQGELCILGSPGIKPYDRIHVFDPQEDMTGDFEVETVIHSLNPYTGFTTTIHPDLIVRFNDNKTEVATLNISKSLTGCLASTTVLTGVKHAYSRVSSPLMKNIMKSSLLSGTSNVLSNTLLKTSLITRNLDAFDSDVIKALSDSLSLVLDDAGNHVNSIYMKTIQGMVDDITKIGITEDSPIEDLVKYIKKLEDFDIEQFDKNFKSMMEAAKKDGDKALIESLEKEVSKITSYYDEALKGTDLTDFFKALASDVDLEKEVKKIDPDLFEYFSKNNYKLTSKKDIRKFNKLFKSDKILKEITKEVGEEVGEEALSKAFKKGLTSTIALGSSSTKVAGFGLISKVLDSGKSMLTKIALKTSVNPLVASGIGFVIEMACSMMFGVAARSIFESWFDTLQTLTIFPMKQYGRPFTAGITGAKACTHGVPSSNGWNSIQGMIIQTYESLSNNVFAKMLLDSYVADEEAFNKMANKYKVNLGILEDDEINETDVVNNLYNTVSRNMDTFATSARAVMTRQRVQSFDKTNKNVSTVFNKYAISNIKLDQIPTSTEVSKLVALDYYPSIQSYIADGRLKIAHNHSQEAIPARIIINGKEQSVNVLPTQTTAKLDWDYPDLPMLQKDASTVLKTILDQTYLDNDLADTKYVFHSGTVPNSNDWKSTGFEFILQASNDNVTKAFDAAKKSLKIKFNVFDYSKISKGYYTFKIYPPIY